MQQEHYINGVWQQGLGDAMQSINPANNTIVWSGNAANQSQVRDAVNSAQQAFNTWRLTSFEERRVICEKFIEILKNNKEDLAKTISIETGKPNWEALTEVGAMTNKLNISVKAFEERTGTTANLTHRPLGVLAILGPFNFPGHLPNGQIIPALLAGNTVVFKPSELTPLVSIKTIEYWHQAGLPQGVLNLILGNAVAGIDLLNQDIHGVLFTGSYATGKKIHEHFAGRPEVLLALEMGGNNPLIVGDINDLSAACYTIIQSAFITGGQRCTCARRLIVINNKNTQTLIQQLIEMTKSLHIADPATRDDIFMGSLISKQAAQAVLNTQQRLQQQAANSLLTAAQLVPDTGLVSPGIIDITDCKNISDEECFGPLLQVIQVNSLEEAVDAANNTQFGLSAGILSDDAKQQEYFKQHIRAGIVNCNKQLTGASSAVPFGGIGYSGNHRPGAFYMADSVAYPMSMMHDDGLSLPPTLTPGISI